MSGTRDRGAFDGGTGAGLLTGATGTVGREVVAGLAAAGAEVQAVTRSPGSARLAAGDQAVRGDLMNPDSLTG